MIISQNNNNIQKKNQEIENIIIIRSDRMIMVFDNYHPTEGNKSSVFQYDKVNEHKNHVNEEGKYVLSYFCIFLIISRTH